jgi:PAS domain S-box-containing protein
MSSSADLAARFAAVVSAQQKILGVIGDPDRVMQALVEQAPEITESAGAVIEMIDGDDLVYVAASGTASEHIGLRLPIDHSLSGVAVRENTLIRCDDTELDFRVDAAACRKIGIRSMIVVPLTESGKVTGVLKSFSPRAGGFDDLDAHVLQLLAGAASTALMHARAARACHVSEQRFRMLFERNIAGVFRTTTDGRILDCNDSLVRTLGYGSREELMARSAWDLYPQRSDRESLLERLGQDRLLNNARIQLKKRDGSEVAAILSVSVIPAAEGGDQLLGILLEEASGNPTR